MSYLDHLAKPIVKGDMKLRDAPLLGSEITAVLSLFVAIMQEIVRDYQELKKDATPSS